MGQTRSKRAVVMSVRHPYSELLVSGAKRIELRRRFPEDLPPGTKALIYASGTTKAIIGECEISKVERLELNELWKVAALDSMVSWEVFKEYFHDLSHGYAISILKPLRYEVPVPLSAIFPNKYGPKAPQSYCYLDPQP